MHFLLFAHSSFFVMQTKGKISCKASIQLVIYLGKNRKMEDMKETKKTTRKLEKLHSRCRVLILHSFIAKWFLYLFQAHPFLKSMADPGVSRGVIAPYFHKEEATKNKLERCQDKIASDILRMHKYAC